MNNSTNLNIRIDKDVKESSEKVFENLGLNMSTAINIYLRQVIRVNGIPFEIKGETPNNDTLLAMQESLKLSQNKSIGYSSIEELKKSLGE